MSASSEQVESRTSLKLLDEDYPDANGSLAPVPLRVSIDFPSSSKHQELGVGIEAPRRDLSQARLSAWVWPAGNSLPGEGQIWVAICVWSRNGGRLCGENVLLGGAGTGLSLYVGPWPPPPFDPTDAAYVGVVAWTPGTTTGETAFVLGSLTVYPP